MKRALVVILMIKVLILGIAGTAMPLDVNLSINNGAPTTYNLINMIVNQDGTITLNVSSTAPPPPGGLSLILYPTSLPPGKINNPYGPETVTLTASGGSGSYTYNCALGSCVNGIIASPSGNTCTVSGTPTASGNCTVNFSVTDATNTTSNYIYFNVTSTPPPAEGILLSNPYPATREDSISVGGINKYYFKLKNDISQAIIVTLSSRDWKTNQDIVFSKNGYVTSVTCDKTGGYYCGSSPTNNETVAIYPVSGKAGDVFYITVINMDNIPGKYLIYWNAY